MFIQIRNLVYCKECLEQKITRHKYALLVVLYFKPFANPIFAYKIITSEKHLPSFWIQIIAIIPATLQYCLRSIFIKLSKRASLDLIDI